MDLTELKALLRNSAAFSILSDEELQQLAGRCQLAHYELGQLICRAGDPADAFFIVYAGRARVVGVSSAGQEVTVGTLNRGSSFGEQGLLGDARRQYTVRAAGDLALLRLDRTDFEDLLVQHPTLREYFERYISDVAVRNFLKLCTVFSPLSPDQIRTLLACLQVRDFPAHAYIVREGDAGDAFYILRSGRAHVSKASEHDRVLNRYSPGDSFGELALLTGAPRSASVVTDEPSSVFRLEKHDFDRIIVEVPKLKEALVTMAAGYSHAAVGAVNSVDEATTPSEEFLPAPAPDEPVYRPRRSKTYPALLQQSETDCGAACLAMILRYYGKHVSIGRLRDLVAIGRDGTSLYNIAEAAETLGFQGRGIRASYEHLEKMATPAVAHWEGFHYVVLYHIGPDHVTIADPAIGLRRLSPDEFRKGWTGHVLVLTPTVRIEGLEESRTTFGRFLPLLEPHRRLLGEIFAASLLLQLFGLAQPIFTQVIVDQVLVHQNLSMLNLMLAGMLVVTVFQAATIVLRSYLLVHTTRRIDMQMIVDFYRHVLSLPMRFFEERKVGDLIRRFNDNARVREFLTGQAVGVLLDCTMIVVYLALMFYYHVILTLVALSFIPGYIVLTLVLTPRLRRQHRETFTRHAAADAHMVESITAIGTVKATASERRIRWKLEGLMVKALNVEFGNAMLSVTAVSASNVLQMLNMIVLFWFGARFVIAGELSVGQLVAFNVLVGNVTRPILGVVDLWNELQGVNMALERLNEVFDAKPEESAPAAGLMRMPVVRGHVRFENVTFGYPSRPDRHALRNVNLEIQAGQTVALVGRSGAGKSTFANLLLRLHAPTGGRIFIDGLDLSHVSISSLRPQIGVVPQEVFLFSGTIRENIAFGDPDAPLAPVVGAAMLAGAHDFISELPLAYETVIGERGQSLSGGQKQRIAIARALFTKPRILIFDEATSALDTESERAIQQNLADILRDRTTLIIAHRLSTVRHADLIVVMERGAIVEAGTHHALMEQRGLYHYLNSQQLAN